MVQTAEKAPGDLMLDALHKGDELGAECKISSHLLLEAMDHRRTGLEILHRDLFDSATPWFSPPWPS